MDVEILRQNIAQCGAMNRPLLSASLDAITVLYNGLTQRGRPRLGAALAAYDASPRKDYTAVVRAYLHDVATVPEANVAGVKQELGAHMAQLMSGLGLVDRAVFSDYVALADEVIQARWQSSEAAASRQ
jgi:hypothetical protein